MAELPAGTHYILNGTRLAAIESEVRESRDASREALMMLKAEHVARDAWRRDVWLPHQNSCIRCQAASKEESKRVDEIAAAVEKVRSNRWPSLLATFLAQLAAAAVVFAALVRG